MSNTGNTQQIIDYGITANDGTGDPLRTAFIKTDENFSNIWLAGPVGSNVTIANNTIQVNSTNGNLVLKPNGVGAVRINGSLIPDITGTRDLGSSNNRFRSLYFDGNIDTSGALSVGNLEVTGDVTIDGNLTVNGNTVTVNVANLEITDKMIVIAKGSPNAAAANGAGITVDGANAQIFYNGFNNSWNVNTALNAEQLTIQNNGSRWNINGGILAAPTGAGWFSDENSNDEYIYSANDGYLNFYTYDVLNNLQSEIKMEHGIIRIKIHNGPNVEWDFDEHGNLTVPGNIIPRASNSYSLGNSTNQWGELWVAGNTIYIGGVPLAISGNVLTVDGQPVLSNDSDATITTTGNITATAFIGDGSLLTGIASGYNDANVAAYLLTYGGNILIDAVIGNTANNLGHIQWEGNSSGDLNGYTTLRLVPDDTLVGNDQYLIIDPTAPGHIHIRAGGTQDNSAADLIFGGENSHVKVTAGDNPPVYVTANSQNWLFGIDGILQAPGDISASGNVIAFTTITTPVTLASLTAFAGARAFVLDANLVASGNFGAQVSGGGANVVPVWSDGTNWYVG